MINRDSFNPNTYSTTKKLAALAAAAGLLASCSDGLDVVRSDIQPAGMDFIVEYDIEALEDGGSETNKISLHGPFSKLSETTFADGAGLKTQESIMYGEDGAPIQALNMLKPEHNIGITNYLKVEPARYKLRNEDGEDACGIKVRQQFTRDAAQAIRLDDRPVDFDALWYYTLPCPEEGSTNRTNIEKEAKLHALVINEQWTPRVTGDPVFINRGHSVTVVGESPAEELNPGWWEYTDSAEVDDVKDAASIVRSAVLELDKDTNRWKQFGETSEFADATVVYSAGDADVYDIRRVTLNRQTDYIVNYRLEDEDGEYGDMKTIAVRPVYNLEWNDWDQNFKGYRDQLRELLNDEGQPEKPSTDKLQEIERSGCQNCPNPTLEQLQFIDPDTGDIKYAFTMRAFKGARDTMFMMGPIKPPSLATAKAESGVDETVVDRQCSAQNKADKANDAIDEEDVMSVEECASILREGQLWDYLVSDADTFGFDAVGHYNVEDNSTWAPIPCGGDSGGTCGYESIERKFNATYKFNTSEIEGPLAVLNMLGEVGIRTLGFSYASGKQQGSGIPFAMEQMALEHVYRNISGEGIHDEDPFMLDSRADQLPGTIAEAHEVLYGAGS